MEKIMQCTKPAVAIIGGGLTALLGGWDLALQVLVLFVVIDYLVGLTAAAVEKKLDSRVGFKGIAKKILCFVPVAVGFHLDRLIGQEILRNLAIWFYIANEGLSILENAGRAGVPVPRALMEALEQLKKKSEGEKEAGM